MSQESPSERRYARTQELIIDAARELLVTQGIEGLSMRALADSVDYSPAALYTYFDSKEAILLAIRERGFSMLEAFIRGQIDVSVPLPERLYAIALAYLDFAQRYPEIYGLMFNTTLTGPEDLSDVTEESGFGGVAALLHQGIARGALVVPKGYTAETLAFHFWFTLHGIAMLRLSILQNAPPQFDALCRRALKAFVASFTAE
ncbi:MAG: TetR/AcrR family transcriptional regulator [Anaerolineae bacterium]|nr:TetR/AcrR family transcriptional regulator [Anaerolineae bacterium]